eukprot:TRINITY_DN4113_c1_g1_i2.p1 TRINITY_DN4113_c1_g1~~TRINITY_DN4113_c1_g1_i2.p1  ORF type:complete len:295 (-),score=35.23 TRINITY_DN4113_c1_g1_i2:26-910(-)
MIDANTKIIFTGVASFALGAVTAFLAYKYIRYSTKQQKSGPYGMQMIALDEERSTTSGAAGGILAYENQKAVQEYLLFHYGKAEDILPYQNMGPVEAMEFVGKCAKLAEQHCQALRDFTGESGESCALDLGCAVGGMTFELAKYFENVLGIDYSNHFIAAAQEMKAEGHTICCMTQEGEITKQIQVRIPQDVDPTRVKFAQGDACNLPKNLPQFDAILAVNLLCRLPDPILFLKYLPKLLKTNGIIVLVSPYSWLQSWTQKSKWLGGYYDCDKKPIYTQFPEVDDKTPCTFMNT